MGRGGDTHWQAVLVEGKRVNGKSVQRHIAMLVGFTESQIEIAAQRGHIWDKLADRLDGLGTKITPANRKRIEAAIAAKVPRLTPA